MTKIADYRAALRALDPGAWEPYLLANSGLPGPRGNLELAAAAADEGTVDRFVGWLDAYGPDVAPTGTSADEFLAFCGAIGLGRHLAARPDLVERVRACANDPRWRIREGAAMALQRLGDVDSGAFARIVSDLATGDLLERRCAVAAICEPRLLTILAHALLAFAILDDATARLMTETDRRSEPFRVLRLALGYAWSVAVVALPDEGKRRMEIWLACDDRDVRWVMRENLKKNRLAKADAAWTNLRKGRIG